MPWKLIGFIVLLIVFVVFSGLNVHKVQLNFGIFSLSDVPLFVILLSAFILGTIITIPFMIKAGKNGSKKLKSAGERENPPQSKQKKSDKTRVIADKIKDED